MTQVKSLMDISKKLEEEIFVSELQILKDKDKINSRSKIIEWTHFSLAYIRISELGCDYLLSTKKLETEDEFLIASVLYNLKHGLEMMVKMALKLTEIERQDNQNKQTHDLKDLYTITQRIISKKYLKLTEGTKLARFMDKLYILTCKYYYMDVVSKKIIENFNLLDKENTLFKYPENSIGISIDYSSLIEKIDNNDIKNIKKDAQRAKDVIYGIFVLLDEANKKQKDRQHSS